ncbi:MAG: hypothetical protein ACFFCW_34635 [Candidatus Hodarchaeota archaeon]
MTGGEVMYNLNRVEVVFTAQDSIRVDELANFLYHVKALYSYLYRTVPEHFEHVDPQAVETIIQMGEFEQLRKYQRGNLFNRDLGQHDLYVDLIEKRSPLTIFFICIGSLLATALVVSGGELDLSIAPPRIRIIMPPIGDGLAKIKAFFRR